MSGARLDRERAALVVVGVQVAADAVSSRTAGNRALGLEKMRGYGATITSVETALLELCGRAGTPEFRTIQRLIP